MRDVPIIIYSPVVVIQTVQPLTQGTVKMSCRFIYFVGLAAVLCISGNARADSLLIDDFSCAENISQTGPGDTANFVTCPDAIGGVREDVIFAPEGFGNATSSITSNPPAGAIAGTIGANLTGGAVLIWSGSTTAGVANLPNLDLAADYILIQSESDLGGTLSITLASGSTLGNNTSFTAAMPANGFDSGFADVLIPLVDPTGTMGTGADLRDVTGIGLNISVPGGGSFELEGVSAISSPEPGTMALVLSAGMLVLFGKLKGR
jgi:hypothetical protein